MIRLTLSQMRAGLSRLGAAAVAIVVATAFVTATLLGGGLVRDTAHRAVTASLGDASVVVHPTDERPLDAAAVQALTELDVVAAADGVVQVPGQVLAGGERDAALLTPAASSPSLDPFEVVEGRAPAGDDEVAVTVSTAERLGVDVGDVLRVEHEVLDAETTAVGAVELRLSGIMSDPSLLSAPLGVVLASRANVEAWAADASPDGRLSYDQVLVAGDGAAGDDAVAEAVRAALPGALVRTALEQAEARTAELTGETETLTYFVLAFAAVAMFVAALVISNTFQVLVAQRARTLALLRCVGATKAQVHRSVLLEALVLGVLASVAGVLVGLGLGQAALWFLQGVDLGIEIAPAVPVTAATLTVPVLTGTAVTVVAALAPARAATRVAPLSALRPAPDPSSRAGGGRLRRWFALSLVTVGALLLGAATAGMLLPEEPLDLAHALLVGILGGVVSFAGVMVGAVFLVPRTVRAAGALLTLLAGHVRRPTVRLATVNAVRNPRRTAATASALVIGVALVTMMATGAATARSSLDRTLASTFPVDLIVDGAGLTPAHLDAVAGAPGIAEVLAVPAAGVVVDGGSPVETDAIGLDPDRARTLLRDQEIFAALADDVMLLGDEAAGVAGVADGEVVTVSTAVARARLTVEVIPAGQMTVLSAATLEELAPGSPVVGIWARVGDDAAAADVVVDVQDALAAVSADAVPFVTGLAAEREGFAQVVDTLLAVVVGLLGVAVVIALVGVANTLSLSVIERRHEHALLRAMGMTRGQLRGTLMVEGTLIAVVGTVLGTVLGLLYGWAGSAVLLGGTGDLVPAVPWAHLGAVAAVALLAGLVASVLPARSAARTPPVAALAA
ncbi:FtsX-like permease family protein [Georgenia daeguensis]|uniref:FtsX-like permease family protein n=1 Tax=Georgenia daeguensis TaxID=908355 RepID=A0ABP8EWQ7_9MICO